MLKAPEWMRPPRDREWRVKENPEQWQGNQGSVGPRKSREESDSRKEW